MLRDKCYIFENHRLVITNSSYDASQSYSGPFSVPSVVTKHHIQEISFGPQ